MEEIRYDNEDGTFTVSHRKAPRHHMPVRHFHGTYEIFYLMSGRRRFFIQDRTIVIGEGDIVVIAPNVVHRTTDTDMPEHERLVVNLRGEDMLAVNGACAGMLNALSGREYAVVTAGSPSDRRDVDALARRIVREVQGREPGFEVYAQTLAIQLLVTCFRLAGTGDEARGEDLSPMHARVSEVVRYINEHYAEPLSLRLLSERFFVSPYYLSRSFKEATGFSFVEYVNSVRVKEAKKLLEQTALQVNQIARKAGFRSVAHFGRVFKEVTGHAPMYYRKGR
ncbi:AraC-like ligand binding domain-containing protein [Cohnella sp. OV330]|uniref:AraC family transcriptional regulator n=1 Tax=Cohnella sp. OV330 TaxID=1855288 RepID=UPI0008E7482E|nr:helix-turn-helix domain-containing protein [Cohnella sp. OV330]SFA92542.1 AraC-like ligand binding domain-containing protein [Cohnella sp. OV330]